MLLSYDPNLYCNPFSDVFPELLLPEEQKHTHEKRTYNHTFNIDSGDDFEKIQQIVEQIERESIDITSSYENWLRVGFCLSTIMQESGRDYYHRISKFYGGYNPVECDKMFNSLLKRNNGVIGLGTLIYVAREHGVDIKFTNNAENQHYENRITAQKYILPPKSIGDKELYKKLSEFRLKFARVNGTRAYLLFSNSTLEELVNCKPTNEEQLLKIKGIAERKVEWFGEQLLDLIKEHH